MNESINRCLVSVEGKIKRVKKYLLKYLDLKNKIVIVKIKESNGIVFYKWEERSPDLRKVMACCNFIIINKYKKLTLGLSERISFRFSELSYSIGKGKKRKMRKGIAFASVVSLIFQTVMAGMLFIPSENVLQAENDNMCSADVDVVLVMDRSGSMAEGESVSKCEWSEKKKVEGEEYSIWFLNVKHDVTEQWCMETRDEFDESFPFIYKALTYTPATNSKIDDAKVAANTFLGYLGANDQSGLVSFADTASLDKQLDSSHSATQVAVGSLATGGATNIGDAITEGTSELGSVRANSQAVKVMILLTDGKANKPDVPAPSNPETYAIDKALIAAGLGYKIFTIGLGSGSEINEPMLQQIANDTGANYYHAPTSAQLEYIYSQISQQICQYASISGCKYSDTGKDIIGGDFSGKDTIPEWEIILTGGANGPITQQTDENGCYTFAGLEAGTTYAVSEGGKIGVDNFEQTYPVSGSHTDIVLSDGDNLISYDFGNYFPVCGNGILDENYYSYNEECDGQAGVNEHQSCSNECTLIDLTYCGDGTLQTPNEEGTGGPQDDGNEQCDDGPNGSTNCTVECVLIEISQSYCGDGIINDNEQCDDGGNNGNGAYCSNQCVINPECNNGVDDDEDGLIDYPEDPECDNSEDNDEDDEPVPYCGDGTCDTNIGENCSTCQTDCGSCGGGGGVITKPTIIITNEKVVYLGGGEALVTWTTNIETTRQVAYGDDSIVFLGAVPEYGYDSVNGESSDMTKEHSVTIGGLTDGVVYYFRPIADRSGSTGEKVGIEVFYEFGEVLGVTDPPVPTPAPAECNYLLEYIKLGADNNLVEVKKLETFLNIFEGESLAVNGIYEQVDFDAVSKFQEKYLDKVLSPWSHNSATGYVYITTKKMINELYCEKEFPLTPEQEAEIARFSGMLGALIPGAETPLAGDVPAGIPSEELGEELGEEVGEGTQEQENGGEVAGAKDEVENEVGEGSQEELEGEEKTGETAGDEAVLIVGEDEDGTQEDRSIIKAFGNFGNWSWLMVIIIIGALVYYFVFFKKKKKEEEN